MRYSDFNENNFQLNLDYIYRVTYDYTIQLRNLYIY